MKNWPWRTISKVVTFVYCILCLLSVTLTYGSAVYAVPWAFYLGTRVLPYLWVFNPMGLVVPIVSAVFTGEKKRTLWQIAVCTAIWLLCTISMASLF